VTGRPRLLSPEQAVQGLALLEAGSTVTRVAELLGVSRSTVRRSLARVAPPDPVLEVEADVWPPPAGPNAKWTTKRWRRGYDDVVWVRLRWVRLWSEMVRVDVEGRVWCDGCGHTVDVAELARPGNSHRVGLFRGGLMTYFAAPVDDSDDGT
jgi:hypothetical protein